MLRTIFVIAAVLQFSNASAQRSFREFVDSAIGADHFSEKDWAIGYYKEQGGSIPYYDSSGNLYPEPELFSTTVIFKIKNAFYLQSFKELCYEGDTCFHASARVPLRKDIDINYTVDSIQQAEKEWIGSYIFKDSAGLYGYQEASPHSAVYKLSFFSRQLNTTMYFSDICLKEKLLEDGSFPQNLNYKLNINTFSYRAFLTVKRFIEENRKLIPLD